MKTNRSYEISNELEVWTDGHAIDLCTNNGTQINYVRLEDEDIDNLIAALITIKIFRKEWQE